MIWKALTRFGLLLLNLVLLMISGRISKLFSISKQFFRKFCSKIFFQYLKNDFNYKAYNVGSQKNPACFAIITQSIPFSFTFPDTKNLSQRAQHLMNDILMKTLILSADAAVKVDAIHGQLTDIQKQCNYRDRPLCDTLKVKSFEEIGFIKQMKNVSRRILN